MLQVLVFLVKGPAAFVVTAFQSAQLAVSTVWQGAKPLGKLARSASGLVRTTSLVATTSGASVADMGQQASACSALCLSLFLVVPLPLLLPSPVVAPSSLPLLSPVVKLSLLPLPLQASAHALHFAQAIVLNSFVQA